MLDGAAAYGNEKDVGAAVKECIDNGIVKRDEVLHRIFYKLLSWSCILAYIYTIGISFFHVRMMR